MSEDLPGMLAVAKGVAEQRWPHTMDAKVWADEFAKMNPQIDHGLMLGWFANAIMAGYDTAQARFAPSESGGAISEVEALRKKQTEAVMPLIGNLLDQWDGVPNDLKDHIREVHEGFEQAMDGLQDAMEGEDADER